MDRQLLWQVLEWYIVKGRLGEAVKALYDMNHELCLLLMPGKVQEQGGGLVHATTLVNMT